MENLHTLAKNGTLTRSKLISYLARQDIDDQDDYGETPLFLAIRGGHVGSVKLLLQSGADVNEKAPDGKTSLYMATQAPANDASIIKLLLQHKAKADGRIPELGNDTPIMEAVRQGKSPEAIRLLIDHGASLTNRNLSGQSAQSLADKSTNTAIHRALRLRNEQPGWKHELENLLVSSALFGLAYFGNWKDIGSNAIRRVAALSVPQAKANEYPQTKDDFKRHLEDFITESGLEDFYPHGNDYVQQVAGKAAELLKNGSPSAQWSKNLAIMSRHALYQPILYCDDSGSMETRDKMPDDSGNTMSEDRMTRQADLVERMADLMTRAAPNGSVHLRFINKTDGSANNLTYDQLRDRMTFTPKGATKLGTNLKAKVLDEFLYERINSGAELERPLLILTITDGCPNEEPEGEFRKVIQDSLAYVATKGYGPQCLRFDLSQVGNDTQASDFLKSWQGDPLVPARVNVTAEHLDARFQSFRDGDEGFDQWLLERLNLNTPINY